MKTRLQRRRGEDGHTPAAHSLVAQKEAGPMQGRSPPARQDEGAQPRSKPADGVLKDMLRAHLSDKPGSCQTGAERVYQCLATLVDGAAGQNVGAQLLTWAENAGARDGHSRQHTAATATWEGVTYVIDTTAAQFGGPDLFIGSVAGWRQTVLNLVQDKDHRVSDPQLDQQAAPFSESAMRQIRAQHEKKHPRHGAHLIADTRIGTGSTGGKP